MNIMDGESLVDTKRVDDLGGMVTGIFGSLHFKIAGLLFLVILLANTTIFHDRVLANWKGLVEPQGLTERGHMIQALFIVLMYLALDLLGQHDCI